MQERIPNIRAKKQDVISILSSLKFNPPSQGNIVDTARKLNSLLFEDIFTGDKDCMIVYVDNTFFETLKDTIFLHLTVLGHQNIKISIYKVHKKDLVI